MADKVLLVKFGEIAMRGDNQYIFINRLILAIRRNLDPVGNYYVVREPGRLIVEDRGGEMDYDLVIPRVAYFRSGGTVPRHPAAGNVHGRHQGRSSASHAGALRR